MSISSFDKKDGWANQQQLLLNLAEMVWRNRGFGDFWSHMLVAEGAVDFAIEPKLALWDMAALEIIVKEAGGRFSDLDGNDGINGSGALSSNSLLHDLVLKQISNS
jgi:histidinol-phosphatase